MDSSGKAPIDPAEQPQLWLEAHYPEVETLSQKLCQQKRIWGEEAEDFQSLVRLHLVERDYAVVRELAQAHSLQTYLYAVFSRLLVDFIRQSKGRFRPSRKAEGLGETAVLLERLVLQQRLSLEEAYQTLIINHRLLLTRSEFLELCQQLQLDRLPPVISQLEHDPPAPSLTEEGGFLTPRVLLEPVLEGLDVLKEGLSPEDQLLLEWRFRHQRSVSEIARLLKLPRHQAERSLNRVLLKLKEHLEAQGHPEEFVRPVLRLLG
jgi:RNA polymerase sigma factor (sigma-70 family)